MKLAVPALGLCVTALLLAGCGDSDSKGSGGGGGGEYADGGTFTMALASDPGNLDPQSSAGGSLFSISQLAYDRLLNMDPKSGEVVSGLATDWKVDGTTVTFTLGEGITCSDGSPLKASDVVANIDYVGNPKNKSPFLGTFLPAGAKAKADDAAGTVTMTLAAPAPFVLQGMANLPIVCAKGMADRKSLAGATAGTGPYELTEAAPGDHYTYQIREGYSWGPDGAGTDADGMPDTVTMKIVQNESTAANLLLSGQLNGAVITGADSSRLEKAGLSSYDTSVLLGEQWYNHGAGHATSDADVRMALTQALDLDELAKVLTADRGTPATTLAAIDPVACPGDSVSGALPEQDVDAAKAVGASSNAPELTFLYDNSAGGSGVAAAAELAVQQWEAAGFKVKATGESSTAVQQAIFGTGDWDIAWVPLNVNSPDQLVPFLSGPGLADGGTNFAGIKNDAYEAGVKKASAIPGQEGCDAWLDAESNLVSAADVVPFANNVVKAYAAGATFDYPGQMVPTSIRMLAK